MARTPRRRVSTPATAGAAAAPGAESPRRMRDNLPRPSAVAPPVQRVARPQPQASPRRNPFGFLAKLQPRFIADIFAELKKVTWPTFTETRYLTFVVAVVALAVGIFLGLLDLFFGWVIEQLFF